MAKNDTYYLLKIIEDIDFIIDHMNNKTKTELEADPVLLDSMMFRLIQISEGAKNLSDELKEKNDSIPWTAIYGLRNRIVHDYGNVDLEIVYDTLCLDVPEVKKVLEGILK